MQITLEISKSHFTNKPLQVLLANLPFPISNLHESLSQEGDYIYLNLDVPYQLPHLERLLAYLIDRNSDGDVVSCQILSSAIQNFQNFQESQNLPQPDLRDRKAKEIYELKIKNLIYVKGPINLSAVLKVVGGKDYQVRKVIKNLRKKGIVRTEGTYRRTVYICN